VAVGFLLAAHQAGAQDAGSARDAVAFAALGKSVQLGDLVIVTDVHGVTSSGALVDLTPASLTLKSADRRKTLELAEVGRVQRRQNGIVLGGIIGGAAGLALGVMAAVGSDAEIGAGGIALDTLLGAAIGIGIDALVARPRTLYKRAERRAAVQPIVGRHTVGVRLALSY
jgi:hypothetical protein